MAHVQATRKSNHRNAVRSTSGDANEMATHAGTTNTKKATILAMLKLPGGTTITAIQKATGWQPHSVRGFLFGHVRKKLGLVLQSEAGEAGRVYRAVAGGGTKRGEQKVPNARSTPSKSTIR